MPAIKQTTAAKKKPHLRKAPQPRVGKEIDLETLSERQKIEARIKKEVNGLQIGKWSDTEKVTCLMMYIDGKTNKEIAKYLKRGETAVMAFVNNLFKAMANMKQSRILGRGVDLKADPTNMTKAQQQELARLKSPELLNQPFYDLLSLDNPDVPLTEAEVNFCWAFVSSDNYEEAIKTAGLDAGLYQPSSMKLNGQLEQGEKAPVEGYKHCLMLRATYLKRKSNIQKFIAQLREEAVYETELNKEYLQREIQVQIDKLREIKTVEAAKLVKEYLMMLGKTVGGFTDKLDIGLIDHARTLDRLHASADRLGKEGETLTEAIARKRKQQEEAEALLAAADEGSETIQ